MERLGVVLVVAGALAGAAVPAQAALAAIDGAYGNAEGCAFFKTGAIVSDMQLLLTPDEVSSYASSCTGLALVGESAGVLTVDGLCSEEGEPGTVATRFTITRNADATFTVDFDELSSWGPLAKCL